MEREREEAVTQAILACLARCEKRNACLARLKKGAAALAGTGSLVALVPFGRMLVSDLSRSGFLDLLSLARSDSGSVAASWSDFFFALLESAPATSTLSVLAILLVFTFSTRTLWTSRASRVF